MKSISSHDWYLILSILIVERQQLSRRDLQHTLRYLVIVLTIDPERDEQIVVNKVEHYILLIYGNIRKLRMPFSDHLLC